MSYFIDGVIKSGSLISIVNSVYDLLIYNDTYSYVNVSDGTISPYFAVLQIIIESTDDNTAYVYFKSGDIYVYPQNGIFKTSPTKPEPVTLVQTTYQPWGDNIVFPGALYTVYDVNNIMLVNPIYLVPSIWYATPCKTPAEASLALKYHIQWMQSHNRPVVGFTVKKECKRGIDYKLCSYGTDCQTNCLGPCQNPNLTCKLLHSEFVCSRSPEDWLQTKFLYILIGIVALILVVAVFITILGNFSKNDRVRTSKTESHTDSRNGQRDVSSQPNQK